MHRTRITLATLAVFMGFCGAASAQDAHAGHDMAAGNASALPAICGASGESATGAQQTTFQAMGQFMGLLTDPFAGRGSDFGGATSPIGYAEEDDQASAYAAGKKTDAFAMLTKAPAAGISDPRAIRLTWVRRWPTAFFVCYLAFS